MEGFEAAVEERRVIPDKYVEMVEGAQANKRIPVGSDVSGTRWKEVMLARQVSREEARDTGCDETAPEDAMATSRRQKGWALVEKACDGEERISHCQNQWFAPHESHLLGGGIEMSYNLPVRCAT